MHYFVYGIKGKNDKVKHIQTRMLSTLTIILKIESLYRFGYNDGKACLLRSICQVASMPFDEKTGLFAEILQILFRYV